MARVTLDDNKRARKQAGTPDRTFRYLGILGVVTVTLGILALVSLYVELRGPVGAAGAAGMQVAYGLRLVAGKWAFLIPIIVLYVGVELVLGSDGQVILPRLLGFMFIVLSTLGIARSGAIGAWIFDGLRWACGSAGARIVLWFVIVAGLSLLSDMSIPILVRESGRILILGVQLLAGLLIKPLRILRIVAKKILLPFFELDREPEQLVEDTEKPAKKTRAGKRRQPKPATSEETEKIAFVPGKKELPAESHGYVLPPVTLLGYPARSGKSKKGEVPDHSKLLQDTLASFGVKGKVTQVDMGPVVTRYELSPAPGIKVSKIVSLTDDIALALASTGIRLEAPIPGKSAIGIEVPNPEVSMVFLREVVQSSQFQSNRNKLAIALGMDIAGKPVVADLAGMLHLLVAGATGSGKSVCLNTLIASLLFKATPDEVKFLMIDPKRVELSVYDGIPHLLAPVVTDTKEAGGYLRWVAEEMDNRYKLLEETGVRHIDRYNSLCTSGKLSDENATPLPYIIVIIDELGDLMLVAQKDVEDIVSQLAFMARAAGIHLVVATQRPSADVVTGIIKMNIPSRIAFAVPSQVDSRVILDMGGAERLLGRGDMLFFPVGAPKPIRAQGAFVSDSEIESIVDFVRAQAQPTYVAESIIRETIDGENIGQEDQLFEDAVRLILETEEASISKLQRRFRIGYTRAARIIDSMESLGIVGPYEGSKPRKVLMSLERWEASQDKV
jgi:S-DNA-T family DNA segregation ATPase FtsK/SpoIIIE